ncbi:PH domain-containing protein [Luteibacter sp. PPL201]|jgi:hypothetical protein|uniref:PH domain-containing protein n=1 Tax=Luteibacter sahnii TaxID=3021977 RepID=A0ABT6B9J4_9GAMM|nr:PH domain-containing protein [Luteibacter sp. PPL193]MDY1546698.1 PH domain-containing protein [Luteibacter sp. PPL193]
MQTFATRMSATARWVGLTTILVCLGVILFLSARVNDVAAMPIGGLLLVVLALAYALSPLRYEVQGHALIVRRQVGRTTFDLRGATVVQDDEAFRGLVRLFGNGGFFAFHGWYWSRRLGSVRVYARNRERGVVVRLANGKPVLLGPDEPDRLVAALRAAAAA